MERIQILGPGCRRSRTLARNVEEALRELGLRVRVEEVADPEAIAALGVLTTPALAVDGEVLVKGRVLSAREAVTLLRDVAAREG